MKINLPPYKTTLVRLGCDPEFFIETNGKVDGSEKIIPKEGMKQSINFGGSTVDGGSTIKRDGVQCELNPRPMSCRAYLHNEIVACFLTLRRSLNKYYRTYKYDVSSKQVIKMDKKILNSLSKEARRFGCAPSRNAYTETENKINVSPSRYLYRSAGGHIHIGRMEENWLEKDQDIIFSDIPKLVKLFDIIVGCTGTLIDRDIWAKERRKVYGRAGDYRLPKYGFEYRTLSNFWLNDYVYMSLMFGLARMACEFLLSGWEEEIFKRTDYLDIETIINKNDINGAIEVFNVMEQFYNLIPNSDHVPLNKVTTPHFLKFIRDYKPKGEGNIMKYWCSRAEGHSGGFHETILRMYK